MKRKHKLLAIPILFVVTTILLSVAFARQVYEIKLQEQELAEVMKKEAEESAKAEAAKKAERDDAEKNERIFVKSDVSYFDDALFIGDSRIEGLRDYGNLKGADYFCSTGLQIYDIWEKTIDVNDVGKTSLNALIKAKTYSKIYIMLGINELGYDQQKTVDTYQAAIQKLQSKEPGVIVYVCANQHVTKARSDADELYNNKNINSLNEKLKSLADGKSVYYIDINTLFDDGAGNLKDGYSNDGVHVRGIYYKDWSTWFCENTIKI